MKGKEMLAHVNTEMVTQIVESVFVTMMDLEVFPSTEPWAPSRERLTAAVHFSGAWHGAMLFECEPWQACRFAALFLSMDPPETVNDDVRDVLGEMANMIGGNIKCAVAMGLQLSMPTVSAGDDHQALVREFEVEDRLAFQCALGAFWVTILECKGSRALSDAGASI
jgi:chemotaxis protein CheX